MDTQSFINSSDPATIEKLYQDFLDDPRSVSSDWRQFFEGFEFARKEYNSVLNTPQHLCKARAGGQVLPSSYRPTCRSPQPSLSPNCAWLKPVHLRTRRNKSLNTNFLISLTIKIPYFLFLNGTITAVKLRL